MAKKKKIENSLDFEGMEEFLAQKNHPLSMKDKAILQLAQDDEEYKNILKSYTEQKLKLPKDKRNEKRAIAEITKDLLSTGVAKIDDEGTELTVAELLVSQAIVNARQSKITFRDLNDLEKVTDNNTNDNNVTINFITNGQDLGD